MKVLIVNKFLYPNGGSETYIFKLGSQLEQMGHEVQYFGMEHEGRIVGNRINSYTQGMDFHTGKLQKLLYPLKIIYSAEAKQKIMKVLQDFKPDVVHLNNFNFQLTPSVIYGIRTYEKQSGTKIKIVFTAHDSQLVCPNHLMQKYLTGEKCQECLTGGPVHCAKNRCIHGSLVKSILGSIEGWVYGRLKTYQKIDAVICPSHFMKHVLEHNPSLKGRLFVMHNFVDVSIDRAHCDKVNYVLYFGRYSEEKGIRTMLAACQELADIPFVFVGSGPLEEQVKAVSNISNKGFLSGNELYEAIQKARFTVFPSECYENCPFTVMESILCGTPVLGAEIGGVPELIENGVTGELFEPGNIRQLVDKISILWHNDEKINEYTNACRKVSFDSTEAYCRKLIEVYKA